MAGTEKFWITTWGGESFKTVMLCPWEWILMRPGCVQRPCMHTLTNQVNGIYILIYSIGHLCKLVWSIVSCYYPTVPMLHMSFVMNWYFPFDMKPSFYAKLFENFNRPWSILMEALIAKFCKVTGRFCFSWCLRKLYLQWFCVVVMLIAWHQTLDMFTLCVSLHLLKTVMFVHNIYWPQNSSSTNSTDLNWS